MSEHATASLAAIQPLFICLGVPKAATTWIHRQLEAHPEVGTTTSKEINYWSSNYSKGHDWYRKQFPNDRDYRLYAEVSVGYLRKPIIERLADEVPEARFMVSLRNPYERSWSSYWQSVRTGTFRGALDEAIKTLPKIIDDSLYSPGLTAFLDSFLPEQLHIALYDDLVADPRAFIRDIYSFAGADPAFASPGLEQAVNIGRKHSAADEAMARAQTLVKRMGLRRGHLVDLGLWTPVERIYSRLARRRPLPSIGERDWEILDEYLRPEVNRLESLFDRDLSRWRVRPHEGFV
ncbi:MAG TPA: sulfotransferase [Acidimicrobiia bacterium]